MLNKYDRKVFVVMFKMIMESLFIILYTFVLALGDSKRVQTIERQYKRLKPALSQWVNNNTPLPDTPITTPKAD